MPKTKKETTKNPLDLAKFIMHQAPGYYTWRANPSDPYFYISFSTKLWIETYGDDSNVITLYRYIASARDFKDAVVAEFKDLIQQQWIDRAGLPIRFLESNHSVNELRQKNIYFILSMAKSECDIRAATNQSVSWGVTWGRTYPMQSAHLAATLPAQYKITKVIKLDSNEPLSNYDRYSMLHEIGHAIPEFKHFRQYSASDKPPYDDTGMTCFDSVMSYYETCPPILEAYAQLKHSSLNVLTKCDGSRARTIIKESERAFPIALGSVDLAAASEFMKKWNERNKKAAKKQSVKVSKVSLPKMNKDRDSAIVSPLAGQDPSLVIMVDSQAGTTHRTIMSRLTEGAVGTLIEKTVRLASSVAKSCPSYFPEVLPANMSYWGSSSALFAQPSHTESTVMECGMLPEPQR